MPLCCIFTVFKTLIILSVLLFLTSYRLNFKNGCEAPNSASFTGFPVKTEKSIIGSHISVVVYTFGRHFPPFPLKNLAEQTDIGFRNYVLGLGL